MRIYFYLIFLNNCLTIVCSLVQICLFLKNMKKLLFLASFSIFGLCNIYAQATLVEKVEAQKGSLIIPYEKYVLPNGLTIIVNEDHSDPVVHLNVSYHVGSARETPGKSGFAHFFEHMLFQGSKHVADEEHFKIIKQYGGDVNGNTTRDRTVYIETFPSNFTETALWMEADRMGCFLEAFTQKKFEIQRATVKNEKDERYDGPYGFLMEVKDQELYPSDHPYSWSTIGFVDDLNRADSNDLKNFFLRWYGPNNACVILSGDVNTQEVVQWCEKYFGSIKRGKEVTKKRVKPVVLTESKVRSYPDPNAELPLMMISYPGVPVYHEDEPAMDMLSYLLGSTKSSILYKKFIDGEWALQVQASNNPMSSINHELAGEFSFTMVGYPWSDMFKLKDMLNASLDSFEFVNFSDNDLARAKSTILSGYKKGLESAATKANYLSGFWYLGVKGSDGKMLNLQEDADRYQKVTREDIMRVYRKYIKGKNSSTIEIKPSPTPEGEKPNKYVSYNPNATYKNDALDFEYQNLKYQPVVDNFDRSKRPEPKGVKPVSVPKTFKSKLNNGLEIWGSNFSETPQVIATITMKGGSLLEDGKEILPGTADMLAMSLSEGTATKTPVELENELESLGASINFNASSTSFSISVNCEKDKLDKTIDLLKDMMFNPRWDKKEFNKGKKRVVESAKSQLSSRSAGLQNAVGRLIYGENSPLGKYVGSESYSKIGMDDIQKYYNKYFGPDQAKVIVVGDLTEEEVKTKFAFLNNWASKNITVTKPTVAQNVETSQIFGVNYYDAEQSDIFIGFRSLPYDATGEFYKNTIMNFALAGNFNSRLNLKIREEKAWTYGIRGGFSGSYEDLPGMYTISAGVKSRATDSAIHEILWEVEKFKEKGLTKEEFDFTKSALLASEALEYESIFQKVGFISQLANRNLPTDFAEKQLSILQNITLTELNDLAKKNLSTDKLFVVVSGDVIQMKSKLENLGFGKMQLLNRDGSGKIKYLKSGSTSHSKNYK